MSRPRRHHRALVILALTPVLLAADAMAWLVWAAWHLMPWLLALAAVGGLVWLLARRRGAGHTEGSEVERLRAEVAWLRRRLAETTAAMHAAWQDASEPPEATVVDLRTRLLRDPRSGARPL